jgi:hypothetical protein
MKNYLSFLFITVLLATANAGYGQSGVSAKTVRVFVQGDSSRLADFVESCKREFSEHGLSLILVSSDGDFQFNVVIAQESPSVVPLLRSSLWTREEFSSRLLFVRADFRVKVH